MSSPEVDGNGSSWTGTEFRVLSRRLTHPSQRRGTEPVLSSEKDVEKGPLDDHGSLNLRDCLTLSNEANNAVWIQPKHVGVTWENLQVVVPGGKDHKVKSFS
jgi:ATP-binding cassette, subfamily G (WHITE), member 2, SNQ2